MQTSFERLESFFYQNNRSERILASTLSVQQGQRPIVLRAGREIEQRLPLDSGGICDVAFSVPSTPRSTEGTLFASIVLMESNAIVAEWEVPAEKIKPGWLRLCLERALGPDIQTPILRLTWDGTEPLQWNTSFFHPDPRFMPNPNSPIMALRVWKYIPGARATLPASGILARGAQKIDRWKIGRSLLQEAVPLGLGQDKSSVQYSEQFNGLMVQPTNSDPVAGRIDNAAPPSVQHIFGGIKTEDQTGPIVEFAYGLVPSRKRAAAGNGIPDFVNGLLAEWYPLPPNEWAELHLFLAEPLSEAHDLFLLTRLAEGERCEQRPTSCFYRITALASAGRVE